jgi:uncharacterized repeat protein (TIGR01451 family)
MAVPGDVLTYTVFLRNTGPSAAANAILTDVLPANTSYMDNSATGGATYSSTLNAVLWGGSLPAGDAVTVTYQAKVVGPLANNTAITNTAQVDDGYGKTWWTNVATTTINTADLSPSSKIASSSIVNAGQVVTFTILVRNVGYVAAGATMVDVLPAGLTLTGTPTVVSGPGTVVFAGNTVTWTGTLDAAFNNQATIRLAAVLTAPLSTCQFITNTATINDGQGNVYARTTTIGPPCFQIHLPIRKNYTAPY